ncbi:CpaE-like family protein [Streptosporangiaceae bacterium NEAU-GS5]|nr:CpaE-like family protein [Streptosporangiaceae bacterium NEAU-GS5]
MRRPLAVTADQELLDDLLRIAAAAGVELDVAHDARHARRGWAAAPLIVVGDDLADDVARLSPPPRPDVVLVTLTGEDPTTWRRCVAVGARAVLELPESERLLVDEFAEAAEPSTRSGQIICVVGGRGGAGATVLAASLALGAARSGMRTMLIDADPLGGGIDVVLASEHDTGARWPDIVGREGRVSFSALQRALPSIGELTVLSWDRGEPQHIPQVAMRAVLEAARRGCDLVVVDLPRHITEAAAETLSRATATLLVVPSDVRGVLASAQLLAALRRHTADVRIVRRPGTVTADVVATSLGAPCLATIPQRRGLTEALDRGDPPPILRVCSTLLHALLQAA